MGIEQILHGGLAGFGAGAWLGESHRMTRSDRALRALLGSRPGDLIVQPEVAMERILAHRAIVISDYHLAPGCQFVAAALLRSLAARSSAGSGRVLALEALPADVQLAAGADADAWARALQAIEANWPYPLDGYAGLLQAARECGFRVVGLGVRPPPGVAPRRRQAGTYSIPLRAEEMHELVNTLNQRVAEFLRPGGGSACRVAFVGGGHFLEHLGIPARALGQLEQHVVVVPFHPDWALAVLGRSESLHADWLAPVPGVLCYPAAEFLGRSGSVATSAIEARDEPWLALTSYDAPTDAGLVARLESEYRQREEIGGWGEDLLPLLADGRAGVRLWACRLAGMDDRPSRALRQALVQRLGDGSGDVREVAASALGSAAFWDPAVRAALAARLRDAPHAAEAASLAMALASALAEEEIVIPELERVISEDGPGERQRVACAVALGHYGCQSEQARSALRRLAASREASIGRIREQFEIEWRAECK